ncbi:hypothetical protein, partial [Paraburkholderia ginsengiterrae]|uniref:hypothetical protein n=1 Tax=Paraburkholderia ginsengiterrae TaxID=1462993 RepID=UPI000AAAC5BF
PTTGKHLDYAAVVFPQRVYSSRSPAVIRNASATQLITPLMPDSTSPPRFAKPLMSPSTSRID